MKKRTSSNSGFILWLLVVLLSLGVSIFILFQYFGNKCREVRTFSIGAVDSKFKISSSDVQKIAIDAANRWNSQTGEVLLRYDPNSSLKINLIYDQRQADVDQFNSASDSLQKNRQTIETSKGKFDQLLVAYQSDLSKYNTEVAYWNAHGGASTTVYNRLEQTRISLNNRHDQLVAMSKTLNLQSDNYNTDLNNLQEAVNGRKNLIITQGLYMPASDMIDIYTFGTPNELRLVLMHELGHAIGLGHATNHDSIMYYLLGDQDLSNPDLTTEDKNMVELRCNVKQLNFYKTILQKTGKGIN